MGEQSQRIIGMIENKHLDPALSEVASFLVPLLNASTEERKDTGMKSRILIVAYRKREANLTRRKTEHGGFKESIQAMENAGELVDSIAVKSGWYFVQVQIDAENEKIVGMVYVKQKTLDFAVQSTM